MRMRNRFGVAACLALLWLVAAPSGAITISLDPSSVSVDPGGNFTIDVVVDGLGDGVAPSVGAYQLGLTWDPTALTFIDATPSGALGIPTLESIFGDTPGVGSVNFFEVSLLGVPDLNALQGSTVVLTTLEFQGLVPGKTDLAFSQTDVADQLGNALVIDAANGATVQVVPEPGAALLFLLGWAVVVRGQRRH